jgi:Uma2 family endonuclease
MLTEHIFTYQEYLEHKPEIEFSYELIAGKIVPMPPESFINVNIALKLMWLIAAEIGLDRVSNKAEIIISGARVTSRFPDVTVFSEEGLTAMQQQNTSTIDLDLPPPILVIEVVSPGSSARERDYRYKRTEYAARGINYYWIVDPQDESATFLELVEGMYETKNIADERLVYISNPCSITIDLDKIFNKADKWASP